MANPHLNNARRIVDINGRLTTVYKRPEGNADSPNRVSRLASKHRMSSPNTELNSYAGDRYVSIQSAYDQDDMNSKISQSPDGESCLFLITDSTLDSSGGLDVYGGTSPVLIHLDTLRTASVNVKTGYVVIKSYSEHHIPKINTEGDSHVTVIVAENAGAEVTITEASTASVVPESGAFGTIYVRGNNAAELDDSEVKHQMLVVG